MEISVCDDMKERKYCIGKNCEYQKAYQILMDYFDELSYESRIEVDERLKEINL